MADVKRLPDGKWPKGVSGNPEGSLPGHRQLTKAAKISKLVDAVLGVPIDDLIQREDGRTNFTRLKEELQAAYEQNGLAYLMKLWLPIAQIVGKTNLQIDIPDRRPLRIVMTNGNGKVGGNGDGKVIDIETAEGDSKAR